MTDPLSVATFSTALGCGLIGGVFFAFSTFVMPALAKLPAPQGIAAMQSINVSAITPLFMLALFGTGAACLFLSGYALLSSGSNLVPLVSSRAASFILSASSL